MHLEKFLALIDKIDFSCTKELIFIDNKSTDNSLFILKNFQFKSAYIIIEHSQNKGKGSSIRSGIECASGDIIGIQDADFEYSFNDIHSILAFFLNGESDVVFGTRFKKNTLLVHRTFHYLVNQFLTCFSNLLSGLYLTDMETGYKFFKSDIIKNINLQSKNFGFEPEVTAKIARLKLRIYEVPIKYNPRSYLEGKKVTWKDGIASLGHIIYFNLLQSKKNYFKKSLPKKYFS